MKRKKRNRKVKRKSGKLTQGQRWFRSLSPEEQIEYRQYKQKQKNERKAKEKREKSIKIMSTVDEQFSCFDCSHHITKSCTDILPNGCEYYFETITCRTAPEEVIPEINKNSRYNCYNR